MVFCSWSCASPSLPERKIASARAEPSAGALPKIFSAASSQPVTLPSRLADKTAISATELASGAGADNFSNAVPPASWAALPGTRGCELRFTGGIRTFGVDLDTQHTSCRKYGAPDHDESNWLLLANGNQIEEMPFTPGANRRSTRPCAGL